MCECLDTSTLVKTLAAVVRNVASGSGAFWLRFRACAGQKTSILDYRCHTASETSRSDSAEVERGFRAVFIKALRG